jgi:hypothetical protein
MPTRRGAGSRDAYGALVVAKVCLCFDLLFTYPLTMLPVVELLER